MNWKAIFIGIACEITFNLLGIDDLIDVAQYVETKSLQSRAIALITTDKII